MRRAQHGLTLVELLVAMLVFAFVASVSVYALRLSVEARDQLATADRRIAEIEIARIMLKEDLAQIVDRPVRDEFGDQASAAFRGGTEMRLRNPVPGETPMIGLVRGGWSNPGAEAPRSSLQYVEYLEKDGALVRRIRPYLDDARGQPHFDRVLISDARDIEARFLAGETRGELDWAASWPLPGRAGAPRAVSLAFESARFGRLEEYLWIGDAGGRRQ